MPRGAVASEVATLEAVTREAVAWRGLLVIGGLLAALLVATSSRYGYHRDELYFILIGSRPAWGYADQPALVPLLAHALHTISGGSLVALRFPSALLAGGTAVLTGVMARELGATGRGQLLAGACMAVGAVTIAVGHLLSTSTVDLFVWTLLSLLLVRALRDGGAAWLLAGLVAGVGLEVKTLVAFFLVAVLGGILLTGPRDVLRSWRPWAGGAIALALWAPDLAWQASHGWPQLDLARGIAGGSSGTSESRWLLLPYQLVLISPFLVAVWVRGGRRLARDPEFRRYRAFPVAYVLLVVIFLATGGKPYYLAGLYPVLLAAGAEPVARRASLSRSGRVRLGIALAASLAVAAYLFLPLTPVDRLAGSLPAAVNYDAGETVGWPRFGQTVAQVYADLPESERRHAIFLGGNYGEAGAVSRFGPPGLPVFSGHNALADLGPPPESATTVIAVGFREQALLRWFGQVSQVGRIDNGVGLDNDEQGNTVWLCRDPRTSWAAIWPQVKTLG